MPVTYTLGVDIGSSSSKGVLVEPGGRIVASAVRPHVMKSPRPGWFEHDADAVWWAEFVSISRELVEQVEGGITAVCTSGIGPCVLITDENATPLRPAILYGVDTRATRQIAELDAALRATAIFERCGSRLTSQAIGPKIQWIREYEPERYLRAVRWFMASSFITYRLTGRYVLDHHSASQAVPFYDSTEQDWIAPWTSAIAPGLEFPDLAWPGDVVGEVTAAAAAATGLTAGTPVLAGTVDAWAEAVSVGADAVGDAVLMYGTSFMLVQTLDSRQLWPSLWSTVGCRPGTYSLAAGLASGGAAAEWVRRLTGRDFDDLLEGARRSGTGANGIVMLPYLAGERTPIFDPDARGIFIGLTLASDPGDLLRAALEGTAFAVRHNLDEMNAAGATPRRLVAVGGGVRSHLWTRIVSSVLDFPQEIPVTTVGASYGDAFLAAQASGNRRSIADWNPVQRVVRPSPAEVESYEMLYPLWRQLYRDTADTVHRLVRSGGVLNASGSSQYSAAVQRSGLREW